MATPAIQRSGVPLLIMAAAVLLAGIAILVIVGSPYTDWIFGRDAGGESQAPAPQAEPQTTGQQVPAAPAEEPPLEPPQSTPAASEQPAQPEPTPAVTEQPAQPKPAPPPEPRAPGPAVRHTVVHGDTLFDLAGRYWQDPYLWPVILIANPGVTNPDFLRPGSTVVIPVRPDPANPTDLAAIDDAHIVASQRYRELGEQALSRGRSSGNPLLVQRGLIRLNKAQWVIYSGLRYDEDLAEKATGRVADRDVEAVRGFIRTYGPRPGGVR